MGVRIGRTQRVTCALMLMIGLLLGTIAPTQEILAKSYDETTAIAVEEEVRVELQATNLQLADVETGSLEKNTFFEKAQTGIRWVIDDMPETERNLLEDQIKENDQMMDRDLQDNQEVNMQMIDEVEIITYGRVICQRLNFRKGPGIKYGIKKVLTRESVCEILSRTKSGWYKIKELSTGITGYVCGKYMKEIRETTALKKQKKQEKKIKAAQRDEKAQREANKEPGETKSPKTSKASVKEMKKYTKRLCESKYEWGNEQFIYVDKIFTKESHWNPNCVYKNEYYGIPQRSKSVHGMSEKYLKDWQEQVKWGLKYIKGKYGTPEKAWKPCSQGGY